MLECLDDSAKSWYEFARTEHVKNDLNPNFSRKITIDYYFETVQKLRFRIFDIDNTSATLEDDDFLGGMECTLANIVSRKTYRQSLKLKHHQNSKSSITIVADEISDNRVLSLNIKATKLDNKDFLGKSDPYLEFWRENGDGAWSLAHRTEVIKNSLNPVWRPFQISLHTLCGGDTERKVKVICYDWDKDGGHDLIGQFFTTVSEIEKSKKPHDFPVINPKKKAKKSSYKNSGIVTIVGSKIEKRYSFLDYIMGGLQINFTIGIDFTGSNGDPKSPTSLHFINPNQHNEYVQALIAVGNVVQDYDVDNLYPAFGFGAKIPPKSELSHEFALNFNPQNPYCAGVAGILQAYHNAVHKVQLWGPTNISPIINHVARFARNAESQQTTPQNYFILLLITDGVITDMDDTRSAIVNASELPMSIIIIGVGQADFSAMEMLDGDDGVLKNPYGRPAVRDIVQFVPFHSLKKSGPVALAKAVLAEVPSQVTKYFQTKGMVPGQGLQPDQQQAS